MKLKNRSWTKITVTLPERWEELATSFLIELGANGVWVEKEGASVNLNIFFPGGKDRQKEKEIRRRLAERVAIKKIPMRSSAIAEEAWQTAWQTHSVPRQRIGSTMMVAPPWNLPAPGRSNRTVIQVLPAMAFGTGTHPTTRNTLLFLEECILTEKRRSFLDVGTGSGILAIAAAKLGAGRVTAVENDPVALEAAEENAKLNGAASKIVFRKTIPRLQRYSCLAANLTAPTLLSLAPSLIRPVSRGGKIILSGILKEEEEAVLNRYRGSCVLLKSKRGKEWVTLLLARR